MRRSTIILTGILMMGCDAIDPIGLADFEEKIVLNYTDQGKVPIVVDGKTYTLRKTNGYDKETGELFVVIYNGHAGGQSFECVGSLEACEKKIKALTGGSDTATDGDDEVEEDSKGD